MGRLRSLSVLPDDALISDLDTVDWAAPYKAWKGSPAAWNHLGRALSRFLTVALGDKFHPLRRKVVRRFPRMDEHPRVPKLTVGEFKRIIDCVPQRYRDPFLVLAATGMRLGELYSLQRSHLDAASGAIDIPASKTKSGVRTIYVAATVWPAVERAIPMPIGHWYLRDLWRAAVDRAFPNEARDLRLHDIRHFTAQQLSNAGVAEAAIQAQLGHSDPNVTRLYAIQSARREVAQAMADILSA